MIAEYIVGILNIIAMFITCVAFLSLAYGIVSAAVGFITKTDEFIERGFKAMFLSFLRFRAVVLALGIIERL